MLYEFGDVVLVLFPFTNQAASKQRPAVIVSSRAYGLERANLVMMAVTSKLRPSPMLGEVWLADWQGAGLLKPSVVKPVIATFEKSLVIRKLGRLVDDDQAALRAAIGRIIG